MTKHTPNMPTSTSNVNPFALVRASDYTDDEINSLWVELGSNLINKLIEPTSDTSKYLLGGKGTGKTHLLRYHSYPVIRRRTAPRKSGLSIVSDTGYLAVFLRASTLDSSRFEAADSNPAAWQQLFGVYLETQLGYLVVEALCDIKKTSPKDSFDVTGFLRSLSTTITDAEFGSVKTLEQLLEWLQKQRFTIDDAINFSAFTGKLELGIRRSLGQLILPLKKAVGILHPDLEKIPVIYLIDEIENFTALQQQVVNTLLRFGERKASFRITGRLYAVKTFAVIGGAETNRDGQEYRVENLDRVLRENPKYTRFAKDFVLKRMGLGTGSTPVGLNLSNLFEEVSSSNFFDEALQRFAGSDQSGFSFADQFAEALRTSTVRRDLTLASDQIVELLVQDLPLILQKLNILLFCKRYKGKAAALRLAHQIREQSSDYLNRASKGSYATAYGHYKQDLFAQLCRESKKSGEVPYAGFDSFVDMSCGNPRNLLIVLGQIFDVAAFKGITFFNGPAIPVQVQTQAARETASFMFDDDCNFGVLTDKAREAVSRLASLLRTGRYALKIPETSPIAVSFDEGKLSVGAREALTTALSYSLVFRVGERKDRNTHSLKTRIQLNPMLSPNWGLSTGMRGDISLSAELADSIFNPSAKENFLTLLKQTQARWSNPFQSTSIETIQQKLF